MIRSYQVWDAPTRWCHWINVVTVLLLVLSGFLFMYRYSLHIESPEAKAAIQTVHSLVGYGFAINLLARIVWGFCGNRHARWSAVLPGWAALRALGAELRDLRRRRSFAYVGRGPLSRLSVSVMFALLLAQAGSGLVRAGVDLYYPPFGGLMAAYIARPEIDPASISWRNAKTLAVPERYQRLGLVKSVSAPLHRYGAYLLLVMIVIHVTGVTLSEVRQQSGAVSAMFSGRRTIAGTPLDAAEADRGS
jgi:cytochrome b